MLTAWRWVGRDGATPVLKVARRKVGQPGPVRAARTGLPASSHAKPTRFSNDATGNTTLEAAPSGTTTFNWDTENRLTSVDAAGSVETYTYDGSTSVPGKVTGLRRTKTTAAGTTYFVWDQQNVLEELDASLARTAQYTDFPGRWGGLSSRRTSAGMSYYGFDLSANTRIVTDELAQVVEGHLYSAFGSELAGTFAQPYGFGGQVGYSRDAVGKLLVRARWLRSSLARWASRDPLALLPGDWPYTYGHGSPVLGTDPSGLVAEVAQEWPDVEQLLSQYGPAGLTAAAALLLLGALLTGLSTLADVPCPDADPCPGWYFEKMKALVQQNCKKSGYSACKPTDTCMVLYYKIQISSNCLRGRSGLYSQCQQSDPSPATHLQQIMEWDNQVSNCLAYYSKCMTSPLPPPDASPQPPPVVSWPWHPPLWQ